MELSERHYLTPLFEPGSVAIIGATVRSGKIGEVLVANMLAARYQGPLFAVNPKYRKVSGIDCFPSVKALPQVVDLAVIATPAPTVPDLIDECGRKGIRAALVLSSGFGEAGPEGRALEARVLANARRHGLRMIGPNCLGILRPGIGLNAAFARGTALPGSLALVSQSGAVCTAMLDWAVPNRIGFSSIISLGGSSDVDFGEIIDYLAVDPRTAHILLYIEGIHDARRFLSSLRAAARAKPVILMKVGRHPAASRAAVSHTGAVVGRDDVFDAAVRRAGVVRVRSIGQLVAAAHALSARVHPSGNRLAVITNGGGPGVMAADLAGDMQLPLAELAPATQQALHGALPPKWSQGNPIDLGGDAGSDRYRAAVQACLHDPGVDGLLVMLAPQAMTPAEDVARVVVEAAQGSAKPVIACWMGEASVAGGWALFSRAGMPVFRTPGPAVAMFSHLSSFYRNQRSLLQVTPPGTEQAAADIVSAQRIIADALGDGRTVLSEGESRQVLDAFHVPVTPASLAQSSQEAADISVEPMIRRAHARELMIGVVQDPVFGPAIRFGPGGLAVEAQGVCSIALPPLNRTLAQEMIEDTRLVRVLGAFRHLPAVDSEAIANALLRVSEMVCELPQIESLEIDPLVADEHGVLAQGVRIQLRAQATAGRRYSHMAIHPYPSALERNIRLADGTPLILRPIRPEDADNELAFVSGLSEHSRYMRFMNALRELSPAMLARFTQIDYDRDMALVVLTAQDHPPRQIGVARYTTNPDGSSCEFAIVLSDDWQGKGLGHVLLGRLIDVARERGLHEMIGYVLANNRPMLLLCERMGFVRVDDGEDPTVRRLRLDLVASTGGQPAAG